MGLPMRSHPSEMHHVQPSPFSSSSGRFGEILQTVTGLLAPECIATLLPSADGSGRGAAIVTAVALRLAAHRREVDQLLAPLRLSRADLERVQALMRREMELGLGRETNANASVRMLPTYVRGTPDGTGEGQRPGERGAWVVAAPLMPCAGSLQSEVNSWHWTWGGPISGCWWCAWHRMASAWPTRSTSSRPPSRRALARR